MTQRDIPLAPLTTFHIGGSAKFFEEVNTQKQLRQVLEFGEKENLNIFILGGGSNILVSDTGYDGIVIKLTNKELDFVEKEDGVEITCGAGMNWDEFVKICIEKNLQGIECLSGIPGTVGAAPVQNIGAYGQELKDTFVGLEAFDIKESTFVSLNSDDCEFGYRDSIFKREENKARFVIWQVTLRLQKNAPPHIVYESLKKYLIENQVNAPSLADVRNAVIELRKNNHIDPKIAGNAGSFFKNPIVSKEKFEGLQKIFPEMPYFSFDNDKIKLFAGWLIEQAGWKGKKHKNVAVSPKHALILINPKHKGTAQEIEKLAEMIAQDVQSKFGIMLEREVQTI